MTVRTSMIALAIAIGLLCTPAAADPVEGVSGAGAAKPAKGSACTLLHGSWLRVDDEQARPPLAITCRDGFFEIYRPPPEKERTDE